MTEPTVMISGAKIAKADMAFQSEPVAHNRRDLDEQLQILSNDSPARDGNATITCN